MLTGFFLKLKEHKIPVSIKEYLVLIEGMEKHVISPSIDEFYFFARTALVKDEANFDKFDKVFGAYFHGIETLVGMQVDVPLVREAYLEEMQRFLDDAAAACARLDVRWQLAPTDVSPVDILRRALHGHRLAGGDR